MRIVYGLGSKSMAAVVSFETRFEFLAETFAALSTFNLQLSPITIGDKRLLKTLKTLLPLLLFVSYFPSLISVWSSISN